MMWYNSVNKWKTPMNQVQAIIFYSVEKLVWVPQKSPMFEMTCGWVKCMSFLPEGFKSFKSDSPFGGGICWCARFSVDQNKTIV